MIRSTFYGFGTALSALNASQKALDVTGNNIANLNTTGYTRQRLDLHSIPSTRGQDRYVSKSGNSTAGQGVNMTGISQVRDPFLDIRFRREAASVGESDAVLSVLTDISEIFDEVQNEKLNQAIMDFRSQLQIYSGRTNESEIDGVVRAAAESLTRMMNQYARQLDTVRQQQEYDLENSAIPAVNSILEKISVLNQGIKECEIMGNAALEMKDERNNLIDELSTYINIEVTSEPDVLFPSVSNLKISFVSDPQAGDIDPEGRVLVDGKNFATLKVEKDANTGEWQYFSDRNGDAPISFAEGSLKGIQDMLNSDGEFEGAAGKTVRGIGYFEKMLDRVAADFAQIFNDANSTDDADLPLFAASDGGDTITAGNITISEGWKSGTYGLTANKDDIPVGGGQDTSGAGNNILHMIALLDKKMEFTTTGIATEDTPAAPGSVSLMTGTFEEFFTSIGNTAALETNSQSSVLSSHTTVLSGIEDLRDGISAVSLDEEGVNLIRYQKSYAAAARFMTTLDEALNILISQLGVVGR